jgi:hypothetical protein
MPPVHYLDLKPGQKIRITQTVRVGLKSWPAVVTGTFRDTQTLVTGLTVERAKDDIVTLPTVRFVKDNGELSSISVDQNTRIEVIE